MTNPMATAVITPIENGDMAAMERLYEASVAANPEGFIQDMDYHGSMADFAVRMRDAGGAFVVMKLDDEVVGMGALRPEGNGRAEVCKLHLRPDLQGKGLGNMLCDALIERAGALGFKGVDLHVTTSQKAAIGLYRKQGFIEDQLEMWRGEHKGKPLVFETLHMHKDLEK